MECCVGTLFSAFNAAVEDLFEDLLQAFPRQTDIRRIYNLHCIGAKSNIRLPMLKFHEFVMVPYGSKLRVFEHAEEFFVNHVFTEVNNPTVVDVLKTLWSSMDTGNKERVYEHLELIINVYDGVVKAEPSFWTRVNE